VYFAKKAPVKKRRFFLRERRGKGKIVGNPQGYSTPEEAMQDDVAASEYVQIVEGDAESLKSYMALSDDAQEKSYKKRLRNNKLGEEIDENIGKLDGRIAEIRRQMVGLQPTRAERDRRDTNTLSDADQKKAQKYAELEKELNAVQVRRYRLREASEGYFAMKDADIIKQTKSKLRESPRMGSVAWQEEMERGIRTKLDAGAQISAQDAVFLETEMRRQLYANGYKRAWVDSEEKVKIEYFKNFKGQHRGEHDEED
jgi:hypothetical protein